MVEIRLEEYFPEELRRMPRRLKQAMESGGDSAALVFIRKSLTLLELVLDGRECPPCNPPAPTGHLRLDTLLRAALIDTLAVEWEAPAPLADTWFPSEAPDDRDELVWVVAATPAALAAARIFIHAADLRWVVDGRPV